MTSNKKKKYNSLEDAGSKHSSEVVGGHAVFFVLGLHNGEEVAEVSEEAVVNVWKLLEQISHIWPRDIITALYTQAIRTTKRVKGQENHTEFFTGT